MLAVPESKLAELKAQFPRAQMVTLPSGDTVVMRPATRLEYKRFQALIQKPETQLDAQEWLFRTMVVSHSTDELMAALDERPGLPASFSAAMAEMCGITSGGHEKKAL